MRIAVLSSGDSHTAKWVRSLMERGHDVWLITMEVSEDYSGADVIVLPVGRPWGYYLNQWGLRTLLGKIKPDILHVHYASGYGTLGRLADYHPSILSVWGSDVFDFPYQSARNRTVIERNLRHYDYICSTSRVMADQVTSLCPDLPAPFVTPFGVDTSQFAPRRDNASSNRLTIGTVKSLEYFYGIDVLLNAFAEARRAMDGVLDLRLLLVGQGTLESELKALAMDLGVSDYVEFAGRVPHAQVPEWLHRIDVFVNVSRAESFGVAVLEASACGVPVITSTVGGLPEVVMDDVTGKMVAPEDADALCAAIVELARDPDLRERLGAGGRKFVQEHYEWTGCVDKMERIYEQILKGAKGNKH